MVKILERLESLAIALASTYFYSLVGVGWVFYIAMILAPDISFIGYIYSKSAGTKSYNLVHNYIFSFLLVIIGILVNNPLITSTGLIFTAHVGFDRFLGFGLKKAD